jgi:putative transposase
LPRFSGFGQKLYLSPILDLCSRDIVSYTISERPALSMVIDLCWTRLLQGYRTGQISFCTPTRAGSTSTGGTNGCFVQKGIRQSMSRKGNCLDNAVMENFFGLLKSELLYLQTFDSFEHFKAELIEYLDYYNNRHSKAKLKGLPPALHRQQALSVA